MPSERDETTGNGTTQGETPRHAAQWPDNWMREQANGAGEPAQHDSAQHRSGSSGPARHQAEPPDAQRSDARPSEATLSNAAPSDAQPSDARPSDARPSEAAPRDAATHPHVDPHETVQHQPNQATTQASKRPREATKFFMPVSPTEAATTRPTPRTPKAKPKQAAKTPHLPKRKPATTKPPQREEATYGPALLGESTVQLVLDLALRIGEVQMSSGAGASDATATILAVTNAYGLPHCEIDVIFTSITVTVHRGVDIIPITAVRLVRTRGQDYTRLTDVERLVRKITAGKVRVHEASAELDQITSAPHPYARWSATVAWAGTAASIAVLIGGDWLLACIAAIITAAIDRVGRYLNRRSLPVFFQQLVGGLLATFLALALVHSNIFAGLTNTSLVVGSAITVLLSGLSVVSTVQDAITGYNVTAAGRTMEITLISAGLIAGVVIGLKLASATGIASGADLTPTVTSALRLPILTVAGAAAAGFFALASYASVRGLLVSAAAGALGAVVYGTLSLVHAGPIASSGIAAVVIGFAGGLIARRLRIPPVIVAVAGLTPLLPGLSTYRALYQLSVVGRAGHSVNQGLSSLVVAITIALALGAGVVLGEYLAQPVRTSIGKLERRFTGPRMAGPLNPTRRRIE